MSSAEEAKDDKARFLTDTEIWGDGQGKIWGDDQGKGQLQVMKAYGTKVGMSDLAVLLGGNVSSINTTTSDGQRSAFVWSASYAGSGHVRAVDDYGDRNFYNPVSRSLGARPALPSSVASSIRLSDDSSTDALAKGEAIQGNPIKNKNDKVIWEDVILYGEYPQTIAPMHISQALESAFSASAENLTATGKKYTFDAEEYDAYNKPFKAKEHIEYEHEGKRYIRVEAKPYGDDCSMLSNGEQAQAGQSYWVEVQPIEWLRDPSGICVPRQALFAGVQFDRNKRYDGEFEKTDIYDYLNNFFMKEIQPSTKELGAAQATPPATAPAKGPEGAAQATSPAKEASKVSAGESHQALADRLSEAFTAKFENETRIRVDAATAAGLKAVLSMMRKSGTINPVDEVSQIQTDNKGNSYFSLSIAEKILAARKAEPEKMQAAFKEGKEGYEEAKPKEWIR